MYDEGTEGFVRAYSGQGTPEEWRDHYQGGPVGYRQREFEPVPGSPWLATSIEAGHALAWNPSVEGPRVLEEVVRAAEAEGIVVNRVSQGSGAMLLREAELRELAEIGAA